MSNCLYIGIDFGTTFSGAAWAFSRQPDKITCITKWRAEHAYNSDVVKTPSEIVYEQQKFIYEGERGKRTILGWGYEVKSDQKPLKWFKLCLEDSERLSPELQDSDQLQQAQSLLDEHGITAVDAAADFLRKLWDHTVLSIERAIGANTVDGLPFRVIVTVPAIWSHKAMQRTLDAAKRAGIMKSRLCGETKLDLVPEPEAAALATLAEFRERPGVHEGDVVTVCDCGGGTTDVVSYLIEESNPTVLVRECVAGDGDMCGGIFVDEGFENVMRSRLGKRWDNLKPEQWKRVMNNEWEHGIKRLFQNEERDWEVRVPEEAWGSSFLGLRRNRTKNSKLSRDGLKLSRKHVAAVFDPILAKVQGLVQRQIQEVIRKERRPPKCILLVGGFGSCSYLYNTLRHHPSIGGQGIEILQASGDGPWTAICRGAVLKAMSGHCFNGSMNVQVTSRISRRHYGICFWTTFDRGCHLKEDRVYDHVLAVWMATNQMRWYLRKGTDIAIQNPVKFNWFHRFKSASDMPNEIKIPIRSAETDDAPNRRNNNVLELCELRLKIETPFDELPKFTNKEGNTYRLLEYDIEMECSGTLLRFSAVVNGIRQPATNVGASYR